MKQRTHRARHWLRKRTAAFNVLANPTMSSLRLRSARVDLLVAGAQIARLPAVPLMKRGLEIDRLAARDRVLST